MSSRSCCRHSDSGSVTVNIDLVSKLLLSVRETHPLLYCGSHLVVRLYKILHQEQSLLCQISWKHYHAVDIPDEVVPCIDGDVLVLGLQLNRNIGSSDFDELVRRRGSNISSEELAIIQISKTKSTTSSWSLLLERYKLTGQSTSRCSWRSLNRPSTTVPTAFLYLARLVMSPP